MCVISMHFESCMGDFNAHIMWWLGKRGKIFAMHFCLKSEHQFNLHTNLDYQCFCLYSMFFQQVKWLMQVVHRKSNLNRINFLQMPELQTLQEVLKGPCMYLILPI